MFVGYIDLAPNICSINQSNALLGWIRHEASKKRLYKVRFALLAKYIFAGRGIDIFTIVVI